MNQMLDALERTARREPEKTAFYSDQEAYTFALLETTARKIGSALLTAARPRETVAVLIDTRACANIPAIFGALYAGCAYAPMDISMPAERLKTQLSLLKPAAAVTDEKGSAALCACGLQGIPEIRFREAAEGQIDEAALQAVRAQSVPTDPMSILFTSGSTGIPKGTVQTQQSYFRWTEATISTYGLTGETVFANQSPFFYANSILEIFPPVALGATVYLLPPGVLTFPGKLMELLNSHRITALCMTPSSFIRVAGAGVLKDGCLPGLKWGIMSGESMPWKPLEKWIHAAPAASWWHFYGSTEMFSVAVGKVEGPPEGQDRLPVGRLFEDVRVKFILETGEEAQAGQPGEMLVSSPWVCAGYVGGENLTAQSFVRRGEQIFFRSGDIGYLRADGQLIVLGRRDGQVKHMGYRMELGELEEALRSSPGWEDGCVMFDRETGRIFCFYTGELKEKDLQHALRGRLPRYMFPDVWVKLQDLPHTSSMKVDRARLKEMMSGSSC